MPAIQIYTVDFKSLPTNAVSGPGAVTIDGKTWYAKGNQVQNSNTYTRGIVNGLGLAIRTLNANATTIGSSGDLDFPHWVLPLAQIPGFDATEPHLFQARFGYIGSTYALMGLCDTTLDGTGLRAAARAKDHLVGVEPTTPSDKLATKLGAAGFVVGTMLARTGSLARANQVLGIRTLAPQSYELVGNESLASGMPAAPSTFLPAQGVATTSDPLFSVARTIPCLFFGLNNQNGEAHAIYIEQLRVWRLSAIPVTPDVNAPVISTVSPVAGSVISRLADLTFNLTDDSGLWALRELEIGFGPTPTTFEQVYLNGAFKGRYTASTEVGTAFTIRRTNGWPYGQQVHLKASVVDAAGNVVVISA